MKKLILCVVALLLFQHLFAQKYEFSAHATSGLFNYSGSGASSASFILRNYNSPANNYVNDRYGTKPTISYGFGLQVQHVSKINIIGGLQLAYENRRSSIDLYKDNHIQYQYYIMPPTVGGYNIYSSHVLSINPFIGYRVLSTTKIKLDVDAGLDVAVGLRSYNKGQTDVDDGTTDKVDLSEKGASDLGYRFELKAAYQRYGISAGYYDGIRNYQSGLIGGNTEVYSRMIRFGLSYRIR